MQWTNEQRQAIESRGGTLLVSAAAGSGKTAVLVERVLRRLTDPADPCGADELLIVTFTRAAAAQMREKIDKALGERLRETPGDLALLRQQQLLPLAQICTIDSFCLGLVREHGAARGLPQELRLIDESERVLLRDEAADETLEAAYEADDEAFERLGLLLEVGGDDARLKKLLLRCADLAQASADPQAWLDSLPGAYLHPQLIEQSTWGQLQIAQAHERLSYCRAFAQQNLAEAAADPLLAAKYTPLFQSDLARVDALLRAEGWDSLRENIAALQFEGSLRPVKDCDKALLKSLQTRRAAMKKACEALPGYFCVSADEHAGDMLALAPVAAAFARLAGDFVARCGEKKARRQAAEFNDILHWALALLVTPAGEKTELARRLGEQYREILVDEYQDVNAAQALLFEALSRGGENLFLVGDVKQSIYRFRQASPELFLEKRGRFARYDGITYPACVLLGRNFRSKRGVTDAVNFAFRQLMGAQAAEIEYSEEEELVCGRADAPATDAELHLLEYDPDDGDSVAAEAHYLAGWIAREIERTGLRPRDFCILLRSDHKPGIQYAQALQAAGVPAYAMETESLFRSREIQLLLSLLRVVDNPVQDVPLTAVLLSPMIGCSEGELAALRSANRAAPSLYHCIKAAADEGSAPCQAFLSSLYAWRRMAAVTDVGSLVRNLLEDTGLLAIAGAMRQPARRKANLHRLADYARAYGDRAGGDLSGFLRYMNRVEADETLLAAGVVSEAADVVRVMSIHKSKGLEFPVCVLAQCARKFNLSDVKYDPLLLHAKLGLGLQRPEPETRRRLPTLPHAALQTAIRRGALAEELRLLYVAMTRAKDRLILLASEKNVEKKLQSAAAKCTFSNQRMPAALVQSADCYADWLLPALLRHPDAHTLREAAGLPAGITLPAEERMHFVIHTEGYEQQAQTETTFVSLTPDPAPLLPLVRERLNYRYPYEALSRLAAKRAVSELTEQAQQEAFAFTSRPGFIRARKISAAQRGTAMHAFLQYADYARARGDLPGEIERLRGLGYLSPRDAAALETEKLARFFESAFAARMLASANIMREKKFTLRIPAAEFAAQDPLIPLQAAQGEEIVVQGIIDCAFEEDGALILLDYKTDRVEVMAALLERYGEQLRLYRRAMRECFDMRVTQTLIYSFWLGDWVEVH